MLYRSRLATLSIVPVAPVFSHFVVSNFKVLKPEVISNDNVGYVLAFNANEILNEIKNSADRHNDFLAETEANSDWVVFLTDVRKAIKSYKPEINNG